MQIQTKKYKIKQFTDNKEKNEYKYYYELKFYYCTMWEILYNYIENKFYIGKPLYIKVSFSSLHLQL